MLRGRVLHWRLLCAASATTLIALTTLIAIAPSIAHASQGKRAALAHPAAGHTHRHYGGPTRSLGIHGTAPLLRPHGRAPAAPAAPTASAAPTNLQNLGGPVMSNVTIYNIFWAPSGDSSPNQSLINQFTEDIGGQLINLLSEYGIQNQLGFGGSWVDTDPLPSGRATYTPPGKSKRTVLLDSDVQSAITAAQNANAAWSAPSLNVLYMVYLPVGTELCDQGNGCTFTPNSYGGNQFCAYHGAYVDTNNPTAPIVYGAMPFDGDRMDVCSTSYSNIPTDQGSSGPNKDANNDSEISTASHEIFEALTDPEPAQNPAWRHGNNPADPSGDEIGDMCNYAFNPDGYSDGGDIAINGDRYFIQQEWDNATSSCVLPGGAMLPTHFYTGCAANTLAATSSGSTDPVTLPFTANFLGTSYDSVYVNSDGTVSFGAPVDTFTPFSVTSSQTPIIAPFFANVDTTGLGPPVPSGLVTYGATTYEGYPALCVDWRNVGYWQAMTDHLDSLQLLLVQRPDAGAGDFDVIFNYDRVQWDSGGPQSVATDRPADAAPGFDVAQVGYSNGSTNSVELSGSGQEGALLDSGGNALTVASQASSQPGRYLFAVRNERTAKSGTLTGAVTDSSSSPLAGALVQACAQSLVAQSCQLATTNAAGDYSFATLPLGGYSVTASPPPGSPLQPETQPALLDLGTTTLDFVLPGPVPPPAGVTVNGVGTSGGIPVIFWGNSAAISYTGGCLFGTASWSVTGENAQTGVEYTVNGPLTESPVGSGDYAGTIPPLYPMHGQATLAISLTCPNPAQSETLSMTIYIDPSGTVVDTNGNPVAGATVTLLRSDIATGPFARVPDGSAMMSPSNRHNPDLSHADGSFGWDVLTGYYEVRAQKAGCSDPSQPSNDYVVSPVMLIPPAVKGLRLVLDCHGATPPPPSGTGVGASQPTVTTSPPPATSTVPPAVITSVAGAPDRLGVGARITVSRAGLAAVGVSCSGAAGSFCSGRLTLTRTAASTVHRRVHGRLRTLLVRRTIKLGSVAYRVAAGRTATLHLRLSAAFVQQLRSAGRRGIAAGVSVPAGSGQRVLRAVRLVAPAPARKP